MNQECRAFSNQSQQNKVDYFLLNQYVCLWVLNLSNVVYRYNNSYRK